jgi:hypothetical protein
MEPFAYGWSEEHHEKPVRMVSFWAVQRMDPFTYGSMTTWNIMLEPTARIILVLASTLTEVWDDNATNTNI